MNEQVLQFVCKECTKSNIPLFLEMGDGYEVERILHNRVLAHSHWTVQSPESLFRLESVLSNKNTLPTWNKLGTL